MDLLIHAVIWIAVKVLYGKKPWGTLPLNLEVYVHMLIYWLTAVGLTPVGTVCCSEYFYCYI